MKTLLALATVFATLGLPAGPTDLPPFAFENYDGRAITGATLDGTVTIVVPTYAKCVFACPLVTFLLTELDRNLGAPDTIRYLHVSIQPDEDSAEEILSHFDDHEIDRADKRWLFANGSSSQIERFLDATGIAITRTPVEGGDVIEHTIRVWVVGPNGRTLAEFDTYFWNEEEMHDAIQTAVAAIQ